MMRQTYLLKATNLSSIGNSPGRSAPDWKPVIWHLSEFRYAGSWWGEALPETFFTYGTPPVEVAAPVEA